MHSMFDSLFITLCYLGLILYQICAYSYCCSILPQKRKSGTNLFRSLLAGIFMLTVCLFFGFPIFVNFLILYLLIFFQFFFLFQGRIATFLFASNLFLFHIMNVKLLVSSIIILAFGVTSLELFRSGSLYYASVFFNILLNLVFLEGQRSANDSSRIYPLIQNSGQMYFVTTSTMLINVYLLILSISYSGQAYSSLAALFLLCTSLLLFGAFYTSYQHGLKMSLLMGFVSKSKRLEKQLLESYESIESLQSFAFTDTLTDLRNRRYGMDALEKLAETGGFCVCFIDIDHLKGVNDRYGHAVGDQYILQVVNILSNTLKKEHIFSRLGGDEFMVLFPQTCYADAERLMESACCDVQNLSMEYQASISYGLVEIVPGGEFSAAEILRLADEKMYACKAEHNSI